MFVLVGTAKGLLVYEASSTLTLHSKHFLGFNITLIYSEPSGSRWWVGISHKHWGQKLHYSDDHGQNWQAVKMPTLREKTLPNGKPAKLRQLWCMAGKSDGTLWLGTDPGALFSSTDGGENFTLDESLWTHPSRATEGQWFGAGSDYPFIHSIVVNPKDDSHIYIAVSCAGVFETKDNGSTWHARNNGLIAAYLPNPNVEVGHDPHILRMNAANPNILWQQNHCGIYRSEDAGMNWFHVSQAGVIPYYGFGLTHSENPEEVWVMPVTSDEQRIAPDLRMKVYKTEDNGVTWKDDSNGLPNEDCFDIVLRQAFQRSGEIMVFGTTNGNLYFRENDNAQWEEISSHLTKVNSVIISV